MIDRPLILLSFLSLTKLATLALSYTDQVPDFGFLSDSLVTRIQNGEVDKEGLEGILTVVGGKGMLLLLPGLNQIFC
jgi:hypothetical protein